MEEIAVVYARSLFEVAKDQDKLDVVREQLGGDRQTARRRVAEAEAPGVGEDRCVERAGDRRRDLEPEHPREIVDQLAGRARGRVGDENVPRRIV